MNEDSFHAAFVYRIKSSFQTLVIEWYDFYSSRHLVQFCVKCWAAPLISAGADWVCSISGEVKPHPLGESAEQVRVRTVPGRAENREEKRLSGWSVESEPLQTSDADQRRFPDDWSVDSFDGAGGGRFRKVQKGKNKLGVRFYSTNTVDSGGVHVECELRCAR